jgi:hypothetical protein
VTKTFGGVTLSPEVNLDHRGANRPRYRQPSMRFSMWERGFVHTVNDRHRLSSKQRDVLDRIERKVRAYRDGGGE